MENWKKEGKRGLNRGEKKIKAKKKRNKNRFMMELVSRWGSPLTSEAPRSRAYPSPVKRRGHTTDLSDGWGSNAPSPWLWRGQVRTAPIAWWQENPSERKEKSNDKLPARCLINSAVYFSCTCDCWDGFVGIVKLLTGSWVRSLTFRLPRQYDCMLQGR